MSQIKDPKKTVAPVDNLLDLQFNPTTNKPKAIKEKDIFDVEKDKKDPKSDRFYPDVALKARQDSMVHYYLFFVIATVKILFLFLFFGFSVLV